MKLVIQRRALKAMLSVAKWVEDQNTEGAGDRWLDTAMDEFKRRAKAGAKHVICNNQSLARLGHRCFMYGNWMIAYKIENNQFIVSRFIWAAKLV